MKCFIKLIFKKIFYIQYTYNILKVHGIQRSGSPTTEKTAGKHCRQKCKDVYFYMALPRVPLPIALVPNDYLDDNQLLK